MFTFEEIVEFQKIRKYYSLNYVMTDVEGTVIFYGSENDVIIYVMQKYYKECPQSEKMKKISMIKSWIYRSVETKIKFKEHYYHIYDKKWERKFKIEKMLNND